MSRARGITRYLGMIGLVALTWLLHRKLNQGDKPITVLFTLPVLASAYLGGLWPGLFTTVCSIIAAIGAPPVNLSFFTLSGIAISLVCEALHRSLRRAVEAEKIRTALQSEQAATRHLRQVIDSLFSFVGVMTPSGVLTEINQAALEITDVQGRGVIGKKLWDTYWFNYASVEQEKIRHAVTQAARGTPVRFDIWARASPERVLLIDFGINPLMNERGEVIYLVPSAVDVTWRKQAQERIAKSEERWRSIFDNAGMGIVELDPQSGQIIEANPWICRILGYSREDILAMTVEELTVPEDRDATRERYRELRSGGRPWFEYEKRYVRRDGLAHWVHVTATAVRDSEGRLLRFIASIEDISARKSAEEALRESEEQFRALAETIPQMVWTARPDGWVDYYNRRWTDYTGMTLEQIKGSAWSSFMHPEDLQRCLESWRSSVNQGTPYEIELRLKRASTGSYRWFLVRALPIRDRKGAIVKWFGTSTDIQEQKAAVEQANQALAIRDEFLSVASHELKTPLTSLKMKIQMRQRYLARQGEVVSFPGGRLLADAADDERQVDRLARLVEDMLDVSRITAGRMSMHKERFDICEMARDVVERHQSLCEHAECSLRIRTCAPLYGEWDYHRLEQVLSNLITNAVKYGENSPIEVAIEQQDGVVEIRVSDQGRGIPREDQERIFERFERAVTSNSISGFGLGLYISKRILELHGGGIRVESEPGSGATFIVTLPVQSNPERAYA